MKLTLLLAILAQLIPGLWFLDAPLEKKGLVEGDAITFSIPVEQALPAGTFVQFGVCMENLGSKAPRHYRVEVQEGNNWRTVTPKLFSDGLSEYSFVTVKSEDRHPTTYQEIFRLKKPVKDSLKVRCRVCSSYAADRGPLASDDPANIVSVKSRAYVGAILQPLGNKAPSKHLSVFLLGNSFTYFYGEPLMLQEIAFSQGLLLNISSSLKGGQTFRDHSRLTRSLSTLSSKVFDYAFLQGQSQEPARLAAKPAAAKDVKLALCELCNYLRSTSPDCKIFVENTWAYESGSFGGFDSMEEFDRLLAAGTGQLANASHSRVSPVGKAFAAAREAGINLYDYDLKHPGLAGAYLKACVTYLVISGKPFKGDVPSCGIDEETAAKLRTIAESIIIK